MAAGVPPPPLNSPSGSYYWLEWYTNLTNFLNGTNIPWSNLNFTGSNIHDIQTRNHNSLLNVQGGSAVGDASGTGNAYHLMGYGWIKGDISSTQMPSGWTVSHPGTGQYVITHNLGLVAPDYMAGATSNTAGAVCINVILTSTNTITVDFGSNAGLNTAVDADFSFWIGKI